MGKFLFYVLPPSLSLSLQFQVVAKFMDRNVTSSSLSFKKDLSLVDVYKVVKIVFGKFFLIFQENVPRKMFRNFLTLLTFNFHFKAKRSSPHAMF